MSEVKEPYIDEDHLYNKYEALKVANERNMKEKFEALDKIKELEVKISDKGAELSEALAGRDQWRKTHLELTKAKQDLADAVGVIEFYGDEMNYSIDDYHGISGEMRKRCVCVLYRDCEERNDVYSYAGMRARQFLSKLKASE